MTERDADVAGQMNMQALRQMWQDGCNLDALHRRLKLTLNDRVKLKLKHVDPDNGEEEAVGSYICVACGKLWTFEKLGFMRVRELLARLPSLIDDDDNLPGGECPDGLSRDGRVAVRPGCAVLFGGWGVGRLLHGLGSGG